MTENKKTVQRYTTGIRLTNPLSSHKWGSLKYIILFAIWIICMAQTHALGAENTNITCGVILSLSGDLNTTGTDLLQGIQLAADEINQNGNTTGYTVDLRIADDKGDPNIALAAFKEMEAAGIPVVIGSETTDITLPMAEETKKSENTVMISPQANGEALYGISPRFYQVNPPIFSIAQFISEWLDYTSDRAAVIYIDDEYGRSVLKNIQVGLLNSTISISGTEPVTREDDNYSALVHRILDGAPDSIVMIVYDSRQIPIIRNLSEAGFRGQMILIESDVIDTLEKDEADAISKFSLFTLSSYTNLVPGSHSDFFVSSYTKRFGQNPTKSLAGYGYDSMMLIADAISPACKNGNISAGMIQKGLDASRYYGVTGPKVFDSHHAVSTAQDRWVFRDGKFKLMTTSLN